MSVFHQVTATEFVCMYVFVYVCIRDLQSFEIRIRIGRPDSIRKWRVDSKISNRRTIGISEWRIKTSVKLS